MTTRVLVGVDGSPSSDVAVDWAVDECLARALPLHVVSVWRVPLAVAGPASTIAVPTMMRVARHRAQHVVDLAAKCAADRGVDVDTEVLEGHPAEILLTAAAAADQLVVGDRGTSAVARFLLGSVSTAVTHHAVGPVTVVRPLREGEHHTVVVGVDGSMASRSALRRAAVEASCRGARLHVVAVWRLLDPELVEAFGGNRIPPAEDLQRLARERAQAMMREEGGEEAVLDVRHGDPVHELLRAAAAADLLVLGSRGLGAVDRIMLGSVSSACLHRAPCPVQVVPAIA